MQRPDTSNGFHTVHAKILIDSYRHWTEQELIATGGDPVEHARRLYQAPFALVSHGSGPDPCFNYGNETAQRLFELPWEQLIRTPSRQSADAVDQPQRAVLMARVARDGFLEHYSGVRVSASGRRFRVEDAVIWNLLDPNGAFCGQAAALQDWEYL